MKQKIVQATLLLSVGILSFSCSTKPDNTDIKDTIKPDFVKTVKTIEAKSSNQEEELTLTGKVEYDPDKVINYVPLMNGTVVKTYFSLGDKIQKGQTLLDVRSADLNSMQAEYTSSEAELSIAKRDYQSAKELYDDNMLSEKELIEAESKLKQAKAAYNKAKNDISIFSTGKGNGIFSIKAPMSGYIVEKRVAAGSTISTDSEPLFVIADLSTVWVVANVYAGDLAFVKEGMDVKISTLSYKDEIFEGKINNISQVFDSDEKVLKARIKMNNAELKLKPEMSTVIKLKDRTLHKTLSIPSNALIFDNNKYFVVVEDTSAQYSVREVKVQGHNADITYVSSGVNEGEKVVVENQLLIYSGKKED